MSDLLQSGVDLVAGILGSQVSRTVTYRRGAQSVSLTATLGAKLLRTTDRQGNTKVERADRDFIVAVADLVLSGSAARPERGDRIELMEGSSTSRYDVMPIGSEPHYQDMGGRGVLYRIHTKYVGTV